MKKKTTSNQSCGRDRECKMVRFKVPQYILNKFGKSDKMRGMSSILSLFRNEFNKFNNTEA